MTRGVLYTVELELQNSDTTWELLHASDDFELATGIINELCTYVGTKIRLIAWEKGERAKIEIFYWNIDDNGNFVIVSYTES